MYGLVVVVIIALVIGGQPPYVHAGSGDGWYHPYQDEYCDVILSEAAASHIQCAHQFGTGRAWCWGQNDDGQVGLPSLGSDTLSLGAAALAYLSFSSTHHVMRMAVGALHSCALFTNGLARCWGGNLQGELGQGVSLSSIGGASTATMGFINFGSGHAPMVDLAAGYSFNCGIFQGGGVKCWGKNNFGQLGIGSVANVGTLATHMSRIRASTDWVCAVFSSRRGRCWGNGDAGKLGYDSTATKGDGGGEMATLPYNTFGTTHLVIDYALNNVASTCALFDNQKVRCWGLEWYGALGYPYGDDRLGDAGGEMNGLAFHVFQATLNTLGVRSISGGHHGFCAIFFGGKIQCWGQGATGSTTNNDMARMGGGLAGNIKMSSQPAAVFATTHLATSTSCAQKISCASFSNHGIRCWGQQVRGQAGYTTGTTILGGNAASGLHTLPFIALNSASSCSVPVPNLKSHCQGRLATGGAGSHSCIVYEKGEIACWGPQSNGELGLGESVDDRGSLVRGMGGLKYLVFSDTIPAIKAAIGATHTCALFSQGGIRCWGLNEAGSLGQNTAFSSHPAASKIGTRLTDMSNIPYIAFNPLEGTHAYDIAAGESFSCALFDGGNLRCWGKNHHGQLGQDSRIWWGASATNSMSSLPFVKWGTTDHVTGIACGKLNTCATFSNGGIRCFGDGSQFVNGNAVSTAVGYDPSASITQVPFLSFGSTEHATGITVGIDHACALFAGGKTRCWGKTTTGRCGYPSTDGLGTHIGDNLVEMSSLGFHNYGHTNPALYIGAGNDFTCVVFKSIGIRCFGAGGSRIGYDVQHTHVGDNGAAISSISSLGFVNPDPVQHLSVQSTHSCAGFGGNRIRCWGTGANGQLGSGDITDIGDTSGELAATGYIVLPKPLGYCSNEPQIEVLVSQSLLPSGWIGNSINCKVQVRHLPHSRTAIDSLKISIPFPSGTGTNHTSGMVVASIPTGTGIKGTVSGDGVYEVTYTQLPVDGHVFLSFDRLIVAAIADNNVVTINPTVTYTYLAQPTTTVTKTSSLTVVAPDGSTPMSAPSKPTARIATEGALVVTWTPPASLNGNTGVSYDITYYKTSDGSSKAIVIKGNPTTEVTLSGLTKLTEYKVYITATSPYWKAKGAEAALSTTDTMTVPEPVSGAKASVVTSTSVTLVWSAPSFDGGSPITSYTVTNAISKAVIGTLNSPFATSAQEMKINGLTKGTPYTFAIVAMNAIGTSNSQSIAITTFALGTTPGMPTISLTNAVPNSITLSWAPDPDDGGSPVTAFKVYWDNGDTSLSPAGEFLDYTTTTATLMTTTIAPLTTGKTYRFQVAAVSEIGESSKSVSGAEVLGAPSFAIVTEAPPTKLNAPAITITRWGEVNNTQTMISIKATLADSISDASKFNVLPTIATVGTSDPSRLDVSLTYTPSTSTHSGEVSVNLVITYGPASTPLTLIVPFKLHILHEYYYSPGALAFLVKPFVPGDLIKLQESTSLELEVSLTAAVGVDLTLNIETNDTSVISLNGANESGGRKALVFTPTTYDIPQTVKILASKGTSNTVHRNFTLAIYAVETSLSALSQLYEGQVAPQHRAGVSVRVNNQTVLAAAGPMEIVEGDPGTPITLHLEHEPYTAIAVRAMVGNPRLVVRPSVLYWSPANFSMPQDMNVTVVDDHLRTPATGPIIVSFVIDNTTSDVEYVSLKIPSVSFTPVDNDIVGQVKIVPSVVPPHTTENGGSFVASVELSSCPEKAVTFFMETSALDVSRIVPATVTLLPSPDPMTCARVATFQVQGFTNNLAGPAILEYMLNVTLRSDDVLYNGLTGTLLVASFDNETPGVYAWTTPDQRNVYEQKPSPSMSHIAVGYTPLAPDVQGAVPLIEVAVSNSQEARVVSPTIPFAMSPMRLETKVVTIDGVDDFVYDGDQQVTIQFKLQGSTTVGRNSDTTTSAISITNVDNETPTVSARALTPLVTTEEGAFALIEVSLGGDPLQTVIVDAASNNTAEAVLNQTRFTFTPSHSQSSNHSMAIHAKYILKVTGVPDSNLADGSVPWQVTFTVRNAERNGYSGTFVTGVNLNTVMPTLVASEPKFMNMSGGVMRLRLTNILSRKKEDVRLFIGAVEIGQNEFNYTVLGTNVNSTSAAPSSLQLLQVVSSSAVFVATTNSTASASNSTLLPTATPADLPTSSPVSTPPQVSTKSGTDPALKALAAEVIEVSFYVPSADWLAMHDSVLGSSVAWENSSLGGQPRVVPGFYVNITAVVNGYAANSPATWGSDRALYYTEPCPTTGELGIGADCRACPSCATCPGGERAWPQPGCWSSADSLAATITECPVKERCLGGSDITKQCLAGYTGNLCAECADGFYADGINCHACPQGSSTTTTLAIAIAITYGIFIIATLYASNSLLNHVVIFLSSLQLISAVAKSQTSTPVQAMRDFFSVFTLISLDISFVRPECTSSTLSGFIFVYAGTILIVMAALILNQLVLNCALILSSVQSAKIFYAQRRFRAGVLLIGLSYLIISTRFLQAMYCRKIVIPKITITTVSGATLRNVEIEEGWYLVADLGMKCFTGTHIPIFLSALIGFTVVTVAAPLVILYKVIRSEEGRLNPVFIARFGSLFESLRPHEQKRFVIALIVSLYIAFIVVFISNLETRCLAALAGLGIYALYLLGMRPYKSHQRTLTSLGAILISISAWTLNYVVVTGASTDGAVALSWVILTATIAFLLIWIVITFKIVKAPVVSEYERKDIVMAWDASDGASDEPKVDDDIESGVTGPGILYKVPPSPSSLTTPKATGGQNGTHSHRSQDELLNSQSRSSDQTEINAISDDDGGALASENDLRIGEPALPGLARLNELGLGEDQDEGEQVEDTRSKTT